MKKNKKFIFIVWGLFISVSVIGLLILLLLFLQPKQSQQSFNQPVEAKPIQSFSQQEQETYNAILNKIDKEVDKLTLKYPHKIYYQDDGKKITNIHEFNQNTGIMNKSTHFYEDGKTIKEINEYNDSKLLKSTYYNPDGTIKKVKTY
ncbi:MULTISPECIES: DUF2963 domain-containing protein [16SrI (Aster yellows group)]|uniref:DUF2963 domain-containing protein n=2 Tax=16SrI (Aster yellows group) TaxID=3042590 RepID=F2X4U7_9MOLU|nr:MULTISPECIES: DUF2963 domain-containing protein [16SrI (Aster yellows group)]AEA36701.1 hypothetical protein [Periwinkle leaf yellowing phytoplasma]GAK74153.1 hypothetical protein OYV_06410 ['Chrysanthemum coronarium' phytoplasma]